MKTARIIELEEKIEDLKKRWPAHSVSPLMFQELEDLEEELERELARVQRGFDKDSPTPSI